MRGRKVTAKKALTITCIKRICAAYHKLGGGGR